MPLTGWQPEPPTQRRRGSRYDWAAITAELREHEGEWVPVDKEARIWMPQVVSSKKIRLLKNDQEWDYLVMSAKTNKKTQTCELWMSAVRKKDENGE